jgi:hypothetical protein
VAVSGGFAGLVGCRLPIQLASLGGPIGTPALAAAVSEAGGLGMIPNPTSAAEVEQLVAATRAGTSRPIGVGFLVPFVSREAVEAAATAAELVEFFYGNPDADLVRAGKASGALLTDSAGGRNHGRAIRAALTGASNRGQAFLFDREHARIENVPDPAIEGTDGRDRQGHLVWDLRLRPAPDELNSQCETTQIRDEGRGTALFDYTKLCGAVPGGQAEYLHSTPSTSTRARDRRSLPGCADRTR